VERFGFVNCLQVSDLKVLFGWQIAVLMQMVTMLNAEKLSAAGKVRNGM